MSQPASNDEEMFAEILQSMGVDNYDPLVLTALNEYARRFAGDILRESQDCATHAGLTDIEPDDIQLALRLSDERTLGVDPKQRIVSDVIEEINEGENRSLLKLLNHENVYLHYPKNIFQQRCYSYLPGVDAFPEPTVEKSSVVTDQQKIAAAGATAVVGVSGGGQQTEAAESKQPSASNSSFHTMSVSRVAERKNLGSAPGFDNSLSSSSSS